MKQIVIGYGTGRCGTRSLAEFLNSQPNTKVTHEKLGLGDIAGYCDKLHLLGDLLEYDADIVGDVGYQWLYYLWIPMHYHPNTKAIQLWRPDEEVVKSFWNYKKMSDMKIPGMWYPYPFDTNKPSIDAIRLQVTKYRMIERHMLNQYPGRIYRLDMMDLNNIGQLNNLLDWLEYSKTGRVLVPVHTNKQHEVVARRLVPKRLPFWTKKQPSQLTVEVGKKPNWLQRTFRRIKAWLNPFAF